MSRMRFGIFLPPHHVPVGQNPTYSLQRDVELVQLLDRMGFDEAWFGEHHSCGVEPIGDPMLRSRTSPTPGSTTSRTRDPRAEKQWAAINAWTAEHEAERATKAATAD